jgi:endo-1,4-beta-xylanase
MSRTLALIGNVMLVLNCAVATAAAQNELKLSVPEVLLWPDGAPKSKGHVTPDVWNPATDGYHRVTNVHSPAMYVFLPPRNLATGAAVVIMPGGAHRFLVMDKQGSEIALRLNRMGIAGFVVKNRLANAANSPYSLDDSFADVQRAIRIVRQRATEWGVDPARVGAVGFSAGGELAAFAQTRSDAGSADAADALGKFSSRPDFVVLVYPALKPADLNVTRDTPPAFLVGASDDRVTLSLPEYYSKLRAAGVPAELHLFSHGGHGFGVTGQPEFLEAPVGKWADRLEEWLQDRGLARKR